MKKLLFIFLIIYSHFSMGKDLKGSMTCKITNQRVFEQTDAKVKEFSGFSSGKEVGDTIEVDYEWIDLLGESKKFFLSVGDLEALFFMYHFDETPDESGVSSRGARVFAKTFKNSGPYLKINRHTYGGSDYLEFQSERFSVGGNTGRDKKIEFARYYKSDWMGTIQRSYHKNNINYIEIIFLDCRHKTQDVYEEIFKDLFEKFNDPKYKYNE